jgi:NADPH2:quinone reductase
MRAWQVVEHGEPDAVMKLGEKAVPDPGPGEVRILVKALALGLPDVFMCRGTYAFNLTIPFTPGQEVVGIVTAAGEGVDLAIDSRVMATTSFIQGNGGCIQGNGGFAEQALAPISATYRIPDDMPDEDAAAFHIPFQTAHIALVRRGQLLPGETSLVHGGAGGVGSAAIQGGAALGARVIATATGPERVKACRALGLPWRSMYAPRISRRQSTRPRMAAVRTSYSTPWGVMCSCAHLIALPTREDCWPSGIPEESGRMPPPAPKPVELAPSGVPPTC